jgi:hypothetical protein
MTCRFKLAIDAQMIAPEGAGSGNSNANVGFACYCATSFSP